LNEFQASAQQAIHGLMHTYLHGEELFDPLHGNLPLSTISRYELFLSPGIFRILRDLTESRNTLGLDFGCRHPITVSALIWFFIGDKRSTALERLNNYSSGKEQSDALRMSADGTIVPQLPRRPDQSSPQPGTSEENMGEKRANYFSNRFR
jgi:hypothetical protein